MIKCFHCDQEINPNHADTLSNECPISMSVIGDNDERKNVENIIHSVCVNCMEKIQLIKNKEIDAHIEKKNVFFDALKNLMIDINSDDPEASSCEDPSLNEEKAFLEEELMRLSNEEKAVDESIKTLSTEISLLSEKEESLLNELNVQHLSFFSNSLSLVSDKEKENKVDKMLNELKNVDLVSIFKIEVSEKSAEICGVLLSFEKKFAYFNYCVSMMTLLTNIISNLTKYSKQARQKYIFYPSTYTKLLDKKSSQILPLYLDYAVQNTSNSFNYSLRKYISHLSRLIKFIKQNYEVEFETKKFSKNSFSLSEASEIMRGILEILQSIMINTKIQNLFQ